MDTSHNRTSERRQLTVLFCDVVDSTGLSERCDLEDLRETLLEFQAVSTRCVESAGGKVVNYIGDGIRAEFGYPLTSENEAQSAVLAGLNLLQGIEALNSRSLRILREPFRVRIGIHTGLAIIGKAAAGHVHDATEIVGDTPNIAARLQEMGEPNTVLVSRETERLLRGKFRLIPRGAQSLKGLSRKIEVFQVLDKITEDDVFHRSGSRHASAMVNRVGEFEQLLDSWKAARSGRGQTVTLTGEAGIGKSRLALELFNQAGLQENATVLLQASPDHQNKPLYPITRWIEHRAGFRTHASAEFNRTHLKELLARTTFSPEDGQHLLIEHLLGLTTQAMPGTTIVDAQEIRRRTRDALVALLMCCARGHEGGLILVEDLHWADPSTIEVVERLSANLSEAPVLLLLTSRSQAIRSIAPSTSCINLARLTEDDCCRLAGSVIQGQDLATDLLEEIVDRSDGVPLFVEELAAAAIETGQVDSGESREPRTGAHGVPSALYDSLMLRLERLGRAKIVAQHASVIGRTFSHELLTAVMAEERAGLEAALQCLLDAGLVHRETSAAGSVYSFKHALVRDVAYHSLLKRQRRDLHGRVADAIEVDFPAIGSNEPDYLARHLSEAGRAASAARLWMKAAQQSASRSANLEALAQLRAALDQVEKLPAGRERDDLELSAQVALIAPTIAVYGFAASQVATVSTRAIDLSRNLDDDPRIFPALYARWSNLRVAGNVGEARELAADFLDLAERKGTRTDCMVGHRLLGTSLIDRETPCACEHLEKAISLHDPARDRMTAMVYGTDVHVTSLCNLSIAYWMIGRVREALERGQSALSLAMELRHAHTFGYAFAHICMLHTLERDIPNVRSLAEQMLVAATKRELPLWVSVSRAFLGWCEVEAGRLREGTDILEKERGFLRVAQVTYWLPMYLCWLAEAHADTGNLSEARTCLSEARSIIGDASFWYESECLRIEARLISDVSQAERCFEKALELARQRGQVGFALRSASSFADHLVRHGHPERGRHVLQEAIAPFRDEPVSGDRADAYAAIRSLENAA